MHAAPSPGRVRVRVRQAGNVGHCRSGFRCIVRVAPRPTHDVELTFPTLLLSIFPRALASRYVMFFSADVALGSEFQSIATGCMQHSHVCLRLSGRSPAGSKDQRGFARGATPQRGSSARNPSLLYPKCRLDYRCYAPYFRIKMLGMAVVMINSDAYPRWRHRSFIGRRAGWKAPARVASR